ncbi:YfdX family protein [Halovulum sp. GXIMD14793]
MTLKSTTTAITLAALLSTTLSPVFAQTGSASYDTQTEMLQTADEALMAVTRARAARLALFENDIDAAKARVAEAMAEFVDAELKFNDLTIGDTEVPEGAAEFLPFDISMTLDETFTVTEEAKQALTEAGALFQSGSDDEAIETLRLASIDVNISAALLPIVDTSEQLTAAQAALDEGKYFEANLALKALEDGVVVRVFSIDAIPEQGNAE